LTLLSLHARCACEPSLYTDPFFSPFSALTPIHP
jgi:hypothetical protein